MRKRRKSVSSQNLAPILLIAAGVVLVLGVLIWQVVQSQISARGAGLPGGPTLTTAQVSRVTPADALAAYQGEQAVLLDVRDAGSFAQEHVTGAVNIPLSELEQRSGELDAGRWIIPYCT